MKAVEIRRAGDLVLIARAGNLPKALVKAGDLQRRDAFLRGLPQDRLAIHHIRQEWASLFAPVGPESLSAAEMAARLRAAVRSGAIDMAFLRTARMAITPVSVDLAGGTMINAGTATRRLVIARKGALPPDLQRFCDNAGAAALLASLPDQAETARHIDQQAGRLAPDGRASLTGKALRQNLSWQIGAGALDAAIITHAPAAAATAARPDAPRRVDAMSEAERIGEALQRSVPYAIEAGGQAIRQAVEDFLTPESIATMIGMALLVAAANTNPLTGAAVDTGLFLLAWWNGGKEAIGGLTDFAITTLDAREASNEVELDAAARAYGKALGRMGPRLLNALVGRLVKRGGGKSGQDAAEPPRMAPGRTSTTPRAMADPNVLPSHLPLDAKAKLKQVLATSNGKRPKDPHDYLSKAYIDDHLAEFKSGPVYKVIRNPAAGTFAQKQDSVFVLPKSVVDSAIARSNGNPRKLERLLGMEKGYLGDNPHLVEFNKPANVRMATGNEENAWGRYWRPGGYTSGGVKEAVIDGKIDPSAYSSRPIWTGK